MTYATQAAVATNATFQLSVSTAISVAAFGILGEAIGSYDETTYQKRQALANQVLANPPQLAVKFAWMLATAGAFDTSTPDATLLTTIQANWSKVAGVNVND